MAATVGCIGSVWVPLAYGGPVSEVHWYWSAYATFEGAITNWSSWGSTTSTLYVTPSSWVDPGAQCPSSSLGVMMDKGSYDAMISAANVVEKLDGSEGIIVVAVVVLALIAGLFFGWKALGRGAGRSG